MENQTWGKAGSACPGGWQLVQVELTRVGELAGQRVNGSTGLQYRFWLFLCPALWIRCWSKPHTLTVEPLGFGLGPSLVGEVEVEVDFDFNFGSKVGGKSEGEGLH